MKLGVRGKLFTVSLAFIGVSALVGGIMLNGSVRRWLEEDVEHDLRRLADTSRLTLESSTWSHDFATADALADRLGESTSGRVTIIAADGRVLGDSGVEVDKLPTVENHGARPEVQAALAEGYGIARRFSHTVTVDLLYVAVPFTHAGERGVVRVTMALDQVEATLATGRAYILGATLVGLALAILVSAMASHLFTRAVRALLDGVSRVAQGSEHRVQSVHSSSDEIGRIAGSFNHMAEALEHSVASLATERERLETILEGMSEGVIALDADRRITLVNGAAVRLLGLTASPAGQALLDVVRLPALAELLDSSDDEASPTAEVEVPGTVPRRLLVRAAPLRAQAGLVVVLHDVTERRRLEAIRRDFVANVSHELRTPVAVVRANAETLLSGALEDPARAEQFVSAILRNAERLSTLVSDLMDLSRIEAGQVGLDPVVAPAHVVVRRAADSVRHLAREKDITLDVEVPEEICLFVDERAADQILLNLLENAVKYTPSGGAVVVRARSTAAGTRIEVQDDGPGIDPRHRERVFERFYRVDPGRSKEMGGTGLGLSIVKHLAEAMSGRVGVDAVRPHGSLFWVLFPATHGAVVAA